MGLNLWDRFTFYVDSAFERDWLQNSQRKKLKSGDIVFFDLSVRDRAPESEYSRLMFFPAAGGYYMTKFLNNIELLSP